ncbi:metallo-beta-lactamase [Photobacterium swingsii]|uniref:MBL fold metallo-hydrolase n=1 Tax=Photobacterium swingsii TaxID=680026 RepID=A0A0J8VA22_9GAMM|nr:MBL fold metallo-hydrolase [Photobacterium swingsii]KMV30243.1 metallo-beta-lactamase [Photobacterium swingsii]PSW23290.1 MBL fold metallo-hydrolase [Photobacterium swingsii]
MRIEHHGAKCGVTGSCHELFIGNNSLLIDCGLFQGEELQASLNIDFPLDSVRALFLTHCHIDHVGRIPWLLAAGFHSPIYATQATAALLPLMLEDGLKIQLGLDGKQCEQITNRVRALLKPIPFDCWVQLTFPSGELINVRFRQAGHILGSAYVEIKLPDDRIVVFSGDLGPCHTPLLVDPVSPKRADVLVLESTYGDRRHPSIVDRQTRLKAIVERSLQDGGAIIIPAFSVGRTQELLFDLENIIAQADMNASNVNWQNLPVVLDSPLAAKITEQYNVYKQLWANEAKSRYITGRHPLSFQQCIVIESHAEHIALINRLQTSAEPVIIVAASGMCTGGRVVSYLEALLPDKRTDVVFSGYQAKGTLGKALLDGTDKVEINAEQIVVNAQIHQLSGYSAHADQDDLIAFVQNIDHGPSDIYLVHGEVATQRILADKLYAVIENVTIHHAD